MTKFCSSDISQKRLFNPGRFFLEHKVLFCFSRTYYSVYEKKYFGQFGKFFGNFVSMHLAGFQSKRTCNAEKCQEGKQPPRSYISPEKNNFHLVSKKKENYIRIEENHHFVLT
jgi:hypothetical protein